MELQDVIISGYANKIINSGYGFFTNNCGDLVNQSLGVGLALPPDDVLGITRPNTQYNEFSKSKGWKELILR
jgi:hypothetical protein